MFPENAAPTTNAHDTSLPVGTATNGDESTWSGDDDDENALAKAVEEAEVVNFWIAFFCISFSVFHFHFIHDSHHLQFLVFCFCFIHDLHLICLQIEIEENMPLSQWHAMHEEQEENMPLAN